MLIGQAIKDARGKMTQVQLAEALKTDQGTVSRWETGKLRPTLEELALIEQTTGHARGFVLTRAGYLDNKADARASIELDRRLSDDQRHSLLTVYDGFTQRRVRR